MITELVHSQTPNILDEITRQIADDPRLKSGNTRRGYLNDLAAFEAWRDGRPLAKLLVEAYAAGLQAADRSPNSINRALAAIRWWARKVADLAIDDQAMTDDERRRLVEKALRVADVKDVTGTRPPKGRHIEPGELAALMRACAADKTAAGTRDAALFAVAWATGLRISELAGLTLGQIRQTGPDEYDLTIQGKGDKSRPLYTYNGAAMALADWLALRGPGEPPEPVFLAISKGGQVGRAAAQRGRKGQATAAMTGPGLSPRALSQILERRAQQAELAQPITWHDWRRSFAGNLLDSGADLVTVQKLMGHSSPTTTAAYDRRGDEVKRKAVRALHVPYRRTAARGCQ